jgi:hypothetical protein
VKKIELRSCRSHQKLQFHIKFNSIRVLKKSYNFAGATAVLASWYCSQPPCDTAVGAPKCHIIYGGGGIDLQI